MGTTEFKTPSAQVTAMESQYGTRLTHDDRDGAQVRVQLTAPADTRQQVMLPRRVIVVEEKNDAGETIETTRTLEAIEQTLWPFN